MRLWRQARAGAVRATHTQHGGSDCRHQEARRRVRRRAPRKSNFITLAGNWQKGVSSGQLLVSFDQAMAQFAAFDGVVVPEPTSLALLAGAGLLARRRRRTT